MSHDDDDDDDYVPVHPAKLLQKISKYGDLLQPNEAAEPILAKPVRGALLEWLTEIFAENELSEAGLMPRRRALFNGKPGTGKTTLAHHLAARLGLCMLVVKPERLISKWVGQTGVQIGELFDLATKADPPVIIFMDEFDSLAPQRKGAEQASDQERNNYVNVMLQRIEQHAGFIIAATNFASSIDQAIWRRFDIHIEIDLPGQFERERILARYLLPWGLPKEPLRRLAEAFATASPALMRQFAEGIKRQIVIGPMVDWDMRRDPTIGRLLAATQPHPDLGKPRLWSLGPADPAIAHMPWPLPRADAIEDKDGAPVAETIMDKVVTLPPRRPS